MQDILALLGAIAAAIGAFFTYKNSSMGQRSSATSDFEKTEAAKKAAKSAVKSAVYSGDVSKINSMLSVTLVAMMITGCSGCFSKPPVVVPSTRYVEAVMTPKGTVDYYKVPPVILEELLNTKIELEYTQRELEILRRTK